MNFFEKHSQKIIAGFKNIFGSSQETQAKDGWNVGDTITFGQYDWSPIEWLILERKGNTALIISKYCFMCYPFNERDKYKCKWKNSYLREYLNGRFLYDKFEKNERLKIKTTSVKTPKNDQYGTSGGGATRDKIFLLSIEEVERYFPSFSSQVCELTESLAQQYSEQRQSDIPSYNRVYLYGWWLRSSGERDGQIAYVKNSGGIERYGYMADKTECVRPAMWVEI